MKLLFKFTFKHVKRTQNYANIFFLLHTWSLLVSEDHKNHSMAFNCLNIMIYWYPRFLKNYGGRGNIIYSVQKYFDQFKLILIQRLSDYNSKYVGSTSNLPELYIASLRAIHLQILSKKAAISSTFL